MSEEPVATKEFDAAIKDIGDKIVGLTLIQAKDLTDYLKDTYGIEPAAGGAVMMAGPLNRAPPWRTQCPTAERSAGEPRRALAFATRVRRAASIAASWGAGFTGSCFSPCGPWDA